MEGAWEAMPQIIIQQEDKRQLDTIRVKVILNKVFGGRVKGKCVEHGPKVLGISELLEVHGSV